MIVVWVKDVVGDRDRGSSASSTNARFRSERESLLRICAKNMMRIVVESGRNVE